MRREPSASWRDWRRGHASVECRLLPTPELLWSVLSSVRRPAGLPPAEVAGPALMAALDEALRAFTAMRRTEGAALLTDLLARLGILRANVALVADRAPAVAPHYREQLQQRLRQAGLSLDIADERVLKEVALFADRCDVTEELTRLGSHLEQLEALLRSDGRLGARPNSSFRRSGVKCTRSEARRTTSPFRGP